MTTIKTPQVTWIDILNPTETELNFLKNNYHVHPVIIDELKHPTVRSRVDDYDNYLYIVVHFPIFNTAKKKSEPAEIDFVITPNTLISVRYHKIEPYEEFLFKCRSPYDATKEDCLGRGPIYLFYNLVKQLYDFSLREIDHISDKITDIEEAMFMGREREMVLAISLVRSDVLNFLRTIKPQGSVLQSLLTRSDLFEARALPYLTNLLGEHQRLTNQAENHKEIVEGLQNTNESLLNTKTNEIVKTLTILAFIVAPLTLIAQVFSINASSIPIIGRPNDFAIIVGIMVLSLAVLLLYFKSKRWL